MFERGVGGVLKVFGDDLVMHWAYVYVLGDASTFFKNRISSQNNVALVDTVSTDILKSKEKTVRGHVPFDLFGCFSKFETKFLSETKKLNNRIHRLKSNWSNRTDRMKPIESNRTVEPIEPSRMNRITSNRLGRTNRIELVGSDPNQSNRIERLAPTKLNRIETIDLNREQTDVNGREWTHADGRTLSSVSHNCNPYVYSFTSVHLSCASH